MFTIQHEKAFLGFLYRSYIAKNGYGKRNLDSHIFYTTMMLPKEITIKNSHGETWHPTVELAKELSVKGLVRFNENRTGFYLTESGYQEASKSNLQIFFGFLNKNPGLLAVIAALIALGSLAVSICALML